MPESLSLSAELSAILTAAIKTFVERHPPAVGADAILNGQIGTLAWSLAQLQFPGRDLASLSEGERRWIQDCTAALSKTVDRFMPRPPAARVH